MTMPAEILLLTLVILNVVVFVYFLILNGYYLVTSITSFRALRKYARRLNSIDTEDLMHAGGAPPVSLMVPAYNEEVGIEDAVRSLLDLRYPDYEVIVINDGSTDRTLEILQDAFDLRPSTRVPTASLRDGEVRGLYRSRAHPLLWVIDKENGGKADALNVGLDYCQAPFFCSLDADSALEEDALLRLIRPFLENAATVAAGGIVRVANGSRFEKGRVADIRLPRKLLPQLQVVEYLRAFLAGRMGWSSLNVMLIVSGAFGMFRRSAVVEVGGYAMDTVGEDMELTLRLHRHFRERDEPYEVAFVPDPVAWTEVPERMGDLGRQRDRWQRGLIQSLAKHRKMLFRPKYGRIGMVAFPYFWFMEGFGPVVEVVGYVAFVIAILIGWASTTYVLAFLILAVVFGILLSVAAVALEELVFRRYKNRSDFTLMLLLSVIESFGYRQILAYWRFRGVVSALLGRQEWGRKERHGVIHEEEAPARVPGETREGSPTPAVAGRSKRIAMGIVLMIAAASPAAGQVADSAAAAWNRGDLEPAVRLYERQLARDSNDVVALHRLALARAWAREFDESMPLFDRLLGLDPDNAEARLHRANALAWSGRYDRAEAAFRDVLAVDPDNVEARKGLARVAGWSGHLREGERRWRDVLTSQPEDVDALVGLAANLRWQGRTGAALDVIDRAEDVAPDHADVVTQRLWLDAAAGPRVSPSFLYESDSDGNRAETFRVAGSWLVARRLGLRLTADTRQFDEETGAGRESSTRSADLVLSVGLGGGWTVTGGGGVRSGSGDTQETLGLWRAGVASPAHLPVTASVVASRTTFDYTAFLAERNVAVEEVAVALGGAAGSRLDAGVRGGLARFAAAEDNQRWLADAHLTYRPLRFLFVGLKARGYGFDEDLDEGYWDPELYGILEAPVGVSLEGEHLFGRFEVAPGYQTIRHTAVDVDNGALRAGARVGIRLAPGRQLGVSAMTANSGLQRVSPVPDADYEYTAVSVFLDWSLR